MKSEISPERERVMKLIKQGKITADEGAELLSALAATVSSAAPAEPFTKSRKIVLVGAALVLIGFFLPWFSFNLGQELNNVATKIQGVTNDRLNAQFRQFSGPVMPNNLLHETINGFPNQLSLSASNIDVSGGDVGWRGWLILGLGLGAAGLPYVATGLAKDTQKMAIRISLAIALLISLYLMISTFHAVTFGLPVVLVGLGLEVFGVFSDSPRIIRTAIPVVIPVTGNNSSN